MNSDDPPDEQQIALLRDSFVHVLLDQERAAELFYRHLFAIAPETRTMFGHDMAVQRRVLIQTLATTITGLSHVTMLLPTIHALGRRHTGYGVKAYHYPPVGEALIHMVRVMARGRLDTDTERAWRTAYAFIAAEMIAAEE